MVLGFCGEPKENVQENLLLDDQLVFPVLEPVVTEDLFEYNVSFKTSTEASGRVDWKVSKDIWKYGRDALPGRLYLNVADVLLLKKD